MYCNNPIEHIVKAGDTLYKLSRQYNTTVSSIILSNARINPYNLQVGMALKICPGSEQPRPSTPSIPPRENDLREQMRMAWLEHVYWTRMFLTSVAGNVQDQEEIVGRLLANVNRIVNLFARQYPQNEVNQLRELLTEHVELVGGLITMMKEGDNSRIPMQKDKLMANASDIARFLAEATPEFNEFEIKDMMDMHLELTEQQIEERLAGEFAQDVETFGRIERQAIEMANYFADGLIRQAAASRS